MKSRSRALKLSMITGLAHEVVVLISGLILPKLMLVFYGSVGNGLVSSIGQFLSFSTILRAGLGGVTRAALFKPLAEGNNASVSSIMKATEIFMRKITAILTVCILALAFLYPFAVIDEYEYWYSCLMVLILGISTIGTNLFGIKNQILLQADQKYHIQTLASITSQILSTIVSIVLITMKLDLMYVKLAVAFSTLSQPVFLELYVARHYRLDKNAEPDNGAIKQRWNAFVQQVAVVVNDKIDIALITVFSALTEVSVYSVHYMVVNNISSVVQSAVTGIGSTFGDMLAHKENENLKKTFSFIEWSLFALGAFIFSVVAIMLTSFVDIYSSGAKDAATVSYHRPLFGFLMTFVALFGCYRRPYQALVEAAGHFKQTRNGAVLEVVINLVVSSILLIKFGIVGVIIGTFAACIVRTFQYSSYAVKNLLHISIWHVIKNYAVYIGAFALCSAAFRFLPLLPEIDNYFTWVLTAIPVTIACFAVVAVCSLIFNTADVKYFISKTIAKHLKKKK